LHDVYHSYAISTCLPQTNGFLTVSPPVMVPGKVGEFYYGKEMLGNE